MVKTQTRVVVIGGGFAGIEFIKNLSADETFQITLVDKNNYHFFPPLLYQVATAFIEPSNISYPFRKIIQGKKNVRFHLGEIKNINILAKTVETNNGILEYDKLIMATGTTSNYFGMQAVEQNAMPMKTIDEALDLRNRLLLNMEKAARATDQRERDKLMNVVIAGGGPTGVELAGMLAEMGRKIIFKEYPEINNTGGHLFLVDAGPVILAPMSKTAQEEAYKVLTNLGVKVILNNPVKDFSNEKVLLSDGSTIDCHTLIWASGVTGGMLPGMPAETMGRGRRLIVDAFNEVQSAKAVYALGDICLQTADKAFPNGHPQVAQVAIQQGRLLGKNLIAEKQGKPLKPFTYHDKGSMAIISKYKAVADLPKFSFKGFFAWLTWLFIHIIPLVGFRNKLKIAFNWLYSFITNNPTLRLIIRPKEK